MKVERGNDELPVFVDKRLWRADRVAAWRLCMGCGACKWICPMGAISLSDIINKGIRPFVDEEKCRKCGKCVELCPGVKLEHENFPEGVIKELSSGWGPVLQLQEGYAADQEVRFKSSSGGVATALALWALERGGFAGVLHIKADPDDSIRNIPTFSKNRDELMEAVGSRYAPAAPCQAFDLIKQAEGSCVFIGKPCDCAALRKACLLDTELAAKVGLIVSIFCAGTPTTAGTMSILQKMKIDDHTQVVSLRYRGFGWPGSAMVTVKDKKNVKINKSLTDQSEKAFEMEIEYRQHEMTYQEAWGDILSKHGQFRCRLCPDKTGEFADIALGDPWYRDTQEDMGRSLILVRSRIGENVWKLVQNHGCLTIEPSVWSRLPESQKSIYHGRSYLWGRRLMIKGCRIPFPVLIGFSLRLNWRKVSLKQKVKTLLGTFRRIVQRDWMRPEYLK